MGAIEDVFQVKFSTNLYDCCTLGSKAVTYYQLYVYGGNILQILYVYKKNKNKSEEESEWKISKENDSTKK